MKLRDDFDHGFLGFSRLGLFFTRAIRAIRSSFLGLGFAAPPSGNLFCPAVHSLSNGSRRSYGDSLAHIPLPSSSFLLAVKFGRISHLSSKPPLHSCKDFSGQTIAPMAF
jgi:hypothetical protein